MRTLENKNGMNDAGEVAPGRYRHYKGKEYTVIGEARHSETLEELIVYRQEYDDRALWVRPKAMFTEQVTVEGQETPRFQRLESDGGAAGERPKNFFDAIPSQLPQEVFQTLVEAENVRIERIISHGHVSERELWYDQPQDEWVILLQGAARLQFEDGMVDLQPGDYIAIPAHMKHRVDWTTPVEPTIWLAVHYSARCKETPSAT